MNIRNIGIIAHIDAGKTTLTERILFNTGKIKYCGEVHEGTTVTDYLQEERQRGISILSAAVSCTWKKTQINLIDTPGHVDFTAEVERCLRVMDGCIAVFCAVNGVQAQSEKVWKQANQYKLPAVAFINKMEREGADYNRVIEQIRSRFNIVPLLMQFPCYIDQTFYGAIDMLSSQLAFNTQKNKDWLKIWKETDNAIDYELQREKFIELLAEYDEKILQAYIGNKFPSYEELQNAITKATKRREILPVFCGSVLHNFGVQSLLDASCQYLPAPQETCGAFVKKIQNQKCAFVFKIFQNMFHNDCAAVRIYSGRLKRGDVLKIVRSNTVVTITKIQRINSAELEDLDSANHGDIVVLQFNQLLDFLKTGDTLVEPSLTFELKPIAFPEPVISITFQGISEEDRLKLPGTLRYMSCQDPTLHVFYDTEKGLWTASGMGELHLQIIKERIESEFRIKTRTGPPQVSLKDSIKRTAEKTIQFVKQLTADVIKKAVIKIKVEPLPRGTGVEINTDDIKGEVPPDCYQAIRNGIQEVVDSGIPGGNPLSDIRITVRGASCVASEASELAFLTVARQAMHDTLIQAGLTEMEPVMRLEVSTPQNHVGNVIADLTARRGRVIELDSLMSGNAQIVALVPLPEMFGYTSSLRSLTGGRADFTAEPSFYQFREDTTNTDAVKRSKKENG